MEKNCKNCKHFKEDVIFKTLNSCSLLGEIETCGGNEKRIAYAYPCCCGDFHIPQPDKFYCALYELDK